MSWGVDIECGGEEVFFSSTFPSPRPSLICSSAGNIEELLSYSDDFPEQLAKFLEPHDQISWLHHLATEDFPMVHIYSAAYNMNVALSFPYSPNVPSLSGV